MPRDTKADVFDDADDETMATPEELELVRRVRNEREHSRVRAGSIAMVVGAFGLLVIVLLAKSRGPQPPAPVDGPSAAVATATSAAPSPEPARPASEPSPPPAEPRPPSESSVELPERTPRSDRGSAGTAPPAPRPAPSREPRPELPALPGVVARQATLDVRAEVIRTPDPQLGAIDYRVRLWQASGEPLSDADVRVRGLMTDGVLVEARLDRAEAPGTYHGLIASSPRGPRHLTIRVSRGDGILEIPVADASKVAP